MIHGLSYVGFASPRFEDWRHFGPDLLGTEMAPDGPDGAVRLRVDDAPWRLAIHPGTTDDLLYLGWNVGDADALEHAASRMEKMGFDVSRDHPVDRPAHTAVSFVDPFGFHHELAAELPLGEPFVPGRRLAGFVTGDQGLGHIVIVVPDLDAALAFYVDVLGLRLSDSVEGNLSVRFLHCPGRAARHHSLAMVALPGLVGVHHLMLEVASMDDVGRAYDLVRDEGLTLAMDLGRHSNDLMTSFYVRTPTGFEIEYGTGGRLIDDDTWEPVVYDSGDLWGHQAPASGLPVPGILRPVGAIRSKA